MNLDTLTYNFGERKEKKNMYCSDFLKSSIDLYLGLTNTPETNPTTLWDKVRFSCGDAVEEVLIQALKDSGIVAPDYDQNVHGLIEFEHNGVPYHGRMDGWHKDGFPIEVKSINNANEWDIKKYQNGNPRESYVYQLASYCFAKDVDTGWLLVCSMSGLDKFIFRVVREGKYTFRCGNVVVDLLPEFERHAKVYEAAKTGEMPDWILNEKKYKFDLDTVDWKNVPKSQIQAARMGRRVIGDWEILYSPWKNLIIEKQGATLGYTEEEVKKVNELTAGYTAW